MGVWCSWCGWDYFDNEVMDVSNETNYWAKMQVIVLPFAMQDLVRFCLGDFIGKGGSRTVFDWKLKPNTVVKFCHDDDCQPNWTEYSILSLNESNKPIQTYKISGYLNDDFVKNDV